MIDYRLVIHYRVLLVLGYEWEAAIEDAAEAVRADFAPVVIDSEDGKEAFLNFLLYPANAHDMLSGGEQITDTLVAINPPTNSRVVLVACAPTYPNLEQYQVDTMVGRHLANHAKKNGIRALEPDSLKEQAEALIRLCLRQQGISPATSSQGSPIDDNQYRLARYEANRWI